MLAYHLSYICTAHFSFQLLHQISNRAGNNTIIYLQQSNNTIISDYSATKLMADVNWHQEDGTVT